MELVGQQFAYREKPKTMGEPVTPVEVVKEGPRGKQVRVKYLDGEYAGLEDWVPKSRLVVPWSVAEEFCRDESLYLEAWTASGDVAETLTYRAADTVFAALATTFDAGVVRYPQPVANQYEVR